MPWNKFLPKKGSHSYNHIVAKFQVTVETVEKPKICEFGACKLLMFLHSKFVKSPTFDLLDSLAIDHLILMPLNCIDSPNVYAKYSAFKN